jgi:hypothetical protein
VEGNAFEARKGLFYWCSGCIDELAACGWAVNPPALLRLPPFPKGDG